MSLSRAFIVAVSLISPTIGVVQAQAQANGGQQSRQNEAVYAPFAFLIGEWDTGAPSAPAQFRQSFSWRASNAYIWFAVYLARDGKEHLHQEGMMTWNAANRSLDFLFVHEPGSLGQEHGVVRVEADGSIVRETTLTGGDGKQNHFRQIWRQTGVNTAATSLLRRKPDGTWAPNFPGSDKLVMTRRP